MIIEVKEGEKIISSREVKLKELNLTERGEFLDLMLDFQINPQKNYFSRIFKICRICTDYPDDELNKFEDAELLQLFGAIVEEKNKKAKKQSTSN
tara:strand:- start:1584 stop:1868 length:285 start_codon:yes stop_codon:yes gene_type:complete